jgi:cytochrome c556
MLAPRTLALAVVGLVVAASAHGLAQKPKDDPPAKLPNEAEMMKVKLKRAQALIEALAKEDYKSLEESANALGSISKAAEFLRAFKTEEYEFQARVFQKSTESLAEKAKARNLDGATLSYLDMTRSCVACHSHFRGRKRD